MVGKKRIFNKRSVLTKLETVIDAMKDERRNKFLDWLDIHSQYVEWELIFDPKRNRKYGRGDLVLVNFGFNVGSEIGGKHWAVVIDNENKKSDPTVMVVPLSSLEDDQDERDVHEREVYLGELYVGSADGKAKQAIACVNQTRLISKLRIVTPKKSNIDTVYRLNPFLLDKIDEKWAEKYTKPVRKTETVGVGANDLDR